MRILAIADDEAKYYYDYYQDGKLKDIDMIIACGDLSKTYLEFLVTMAGCPLFYVNGNHDESFVKDPPEGCECIDGKLVVYKGIRILGLGGSYRYRSGTYLYTEGQMKRRILHLLPSLLYHKGFDILVTHAPARKINDFDSLSHRGFACFVTLLEKYRPRYFIHGHIHKNYGVHIPRKTQYQDTTIINAYEYCLIDYKEKEE